MDKMALHAAPVTKIRVMQRDFLSEDEFERLIQAADFAEFLQLARSLTLFEDLPAEASEPRELQHYLLARYARQIQKVERFYPLSYKKFFDCIRDRFLVEDLKRRARLNGVLALLHEIEDQSEAALCTQEEQLLLPGRREDYLRLLRESMVHPEDNEFEFEMKLDQNYYQQLEKSLDGLSGGDRKTVLEPIGLDVDMKNLRFIRRAKRYYELSPSLILNATLPGGKMIHLDELNALAHMSEEEVEGFIAASPYAEVFVGELNSQVLRIESFLLQHLHRLKARDEHSLATFVEFLHSWEFQYRDIFTIMEAKDNSSESLDLDALVLRTVLRHEQKERSVADGH